MIKTKSHYEDVKDCCWFNPTKKSYRCEAKILKSFVTGERYNCVKNGRCFWHKSVQEHNVEIAKRKEEWERETYIRLKNKFEPSEMKP